MNGMFKHIIIILLHVISSMAAAYMEPPRYSYIITSNASSLDTVTIKTSKSYFKMFYDTTESWFGENGHGYAYRIDNTGKENVLWRVNGWYSFNTYISDDGEHLIRLGNLPSGKEPKLEDLGIAFYKKGVLLKRYSTKDLLSATPAKSFFPHYRFLYSINGILLWPKDNLFSIITTDYHEHVFDIRTGNKIAYSFKRNLYIRDKIRQARENFLFDLRSMNNDIKQTLRFFKELFTIRP